MTDLENVITGLECCQSKSHCDECPYLYEGLCNIRTCTADLASDALALLKEREPKPVTITTNVYGKKFYHCPNCCKTFYEPWEIHKRYCNNCGQAVKWDD